MDGKRSGELVFYFLFNRVLLDIPYISGHTYQETQFVKKSIKVIFYSVSRSVLVLQVMWNNV